MTRHSIDRRILLHGAATAALTTTLPGRFAQAQTPQATPQPIWPNRFVRLIVPFTPGGGIDSIARIIGAKLSETWGQQVVVENKPGAGGNLASEIVARAEPDGYTMYISAAGLSVNQYLYASIGYDPVADFAPITLICLFHNLMVVPTSSPHKTIEEFLAYARANPGKLTFGTPGHGSSPHMSGELFKYLAKVDMTHIPYRGAAAALNDVIGGRVDTTFAVMASGLPLVRSGQLRAIGVTTTTRQPSAPEVPTIAEAGVPGYDASSWFAFFVPAKTPRDIVAKMHADTIAALKDPAVKERLDQLGVIIVGSTPQELAAHLKAEMERWAPVIKAAGIKVSD